MFEYFSTLYMEELMLFISLLKNFYAGKEKVFVEKIKLLNSIED